MFHTGSYNNNNREIDPGDVVYAVETATGTGTAAFWVMLNYSEFGVGG